MARKILCRLGRHHWVRRHNEDGKTYTECSRCGRYKPAFDGAAAPRIPPVPPGFGGG